MFVLGFFIGLEPFWLVKHTNLRILYHYPNQLPHLILIITKVRGKASSVKRRLSIYLQENKALCRKVELHMIMPRL
jgi:hypothetical protein